MSDPECPPMAELERLRELIAINRTITGSLDYDEVLQRVVEKTVDLTGAESCLLLLANREGQAVVAASQGIDPALASRFSAPLDERIDAVLSAFLGLHDAMAFTATPVMNSQGLRGILAIFRRCERAAYPEEEFLLAALADQAAIALQHATRYRDLLRDFRGRETLTERIFQHAPLGFCVLDAALRVLDVNATGAELLGYSRDRIMGQPLVKSLGSAETEILPLCRRVLSGEPSVSKEVRYEIPGRTAKQETVLDLVCVELPNEAGRAEAVLMILQDISQRKRLEDERQRFVSLAERSQEFIGMCDSDFSPFFANAAGLRLVGLDDLESAMRVKVQDFFFPEDQPFITQEFFPDAMRNGQAEVEIRFRHFKTGEAIWMLYSVFSIFDADGAAAGWATVSRNIHDHKLAEQALREKQEDLNRAQALGNIGSWRLDARRNALTWSPEHHRIFGIPEGAPLSYECFLSAVHPNDRDIVDRMWQAALRGEPYDIEHRIVVNGQVKWVRDKAELEFDEANNLRGAFGATQDITEKRNIEEALREASQRKDEFLAMLGHELRNPLTPISNVAKIMCSQSLDESTLNWAREALRRNVAQIKHIVDDLLDVSRITRGLVTLKRERIELSTLLHDSSETIHSLINSKHQTLHCELPKQPVHLEGDAVRLIQVFTNLLNNAAKYTGEGGRIDLLAGVEGPSAVVRVKDNGMGISPRLLPHIFDLFTQDERGLDRPEGGLGIGLTLVKKLVELHGGQITAQSPGMNQGSEFIVRLPRIVEAAAQADPLKPQASTGESSQGMRILLIDDNEDVTDGLALLFEMLGHQVEVAHDGPQGLSAAQHFEPDVILLDIGLPGMDGYQVAQSLREQPRTQRVLIIGLSGYGLIQNISSAEAAGFDHYLIKPPDLQELQNLIAEFQRLGPK